MQGRGTTAWATEALQGQCEERRKTEAAPLNVYLLVKDRFDARRHPVEDFVFHSLNAFSTGSGDGNYGDGNRGTSPSRLYTYSAFFKALGAMTVGGIIGDSYRADANPFVPGYANLDDAHVGDAANRAFFLGQDNPSNPNALDYAVVHVCAFLANAMVEAIQFDACEEFNGISQR